jgi:hypothetical protein
MPEIESAGRAAPLAGARSPLRRLLPQGVIAFAGHCLERIEIDDLDDPPVIEIDDLDDPPGIADSASRLYLDGHLVDRRASGAPSISERNLASA